MAIKPLPIHTADPPENVPYQLVGFFKTSKEANEWRVASLKAGHKYPFWLQVKRKNFVEATGGNRYILWYYKPRKGKMIGRGFK
jgi:hypothetical protein